MNSTEPTVRILTFDEFLREESAWNELVLSSRSPVPFLCHQWLCAWWRHFGEGQEFAAPVVTVGGSFVAGAALGVRRVRGLPLRVAEIVGTAPVPTRGMGLADKADLLVRDDAPHALEPLASALQKLLGRVDVLDVKGFDEGSPTGGSLGRSARELVRSVSSYLTLPSTWDEYLASRSGNFRKHLRKYKRGLDGLGSVELRRLGPQDDCAAWMSEVLAVNDASWKAERGTNLFRHPSIQGFFVDLVPRMAEAGWLDLHMLRLDGKAVAYELCFDFGGRVFSYNGSYRQELGKHSPGTVVTAAVIEAACARGCSEYDMLRGEESYKTRWSETSRTEHQSFVAASRPLARLYGYWGIYAKARMKGWRWLSELDDRLTGWRTRLRHK